MGGTERLVSLKVNERIKMMTDHEQLTELEPLMRTLGWWPEMLEFDDDLYYQDKPFVPHSSWTYTTDEDYAELLDEHALAIVTHRAEKELCNLRYISYKSNKAEIWNFPSHRGFYTIDKDAGEVFHSLADALRVEIEREDNKEAQSHTPPYK